MTFINSDFTSISRLFCLLECHNLTFRWIKLSKDICASSVEVLGANVRISSACWKPPAYMLFTDAPIERACSCLRSGSIMSRNRAGDKTDPCLTPCPRAKGGETCCPRQTELRPSDYQFLSKYHVLEFIPAWNSLFRSTENSTESNAFSKS